MTRPANILVLGSGGREHAIARRILSENRMTGSHIHVFVSPGNPGMTMTDPEIQIPSELSNISTNLQSAITPFCKSNRIDLVVVGPENLLADGMVDDLVRSRIPTYGPSKAAAMLETSKIFSKSFMNQYGIPTARSREYRSIDACIFDLKSSALSDWSGYVIKLSGLHAGKGVYVTKDLNDALHVLHELKIERQKTEQDGFLLEEKLDGKEVSVFYSVLNDQFCFLGDACDHKRLLDHDEGPNTGGMGAFSPSFLNGDDHNTIEQTILRPTLNGMIKRGVPFRGTLFIGLMVTENKQFKVLEYNTRFGDPETQTLLPRIQGPLLDLMVAVAKEDEIAFREMKKKIHLSPEKSVHVVKVAKGYPASPVLGDEIIFSSSSIEDTSTFLTFASVTSSHSSNGASTGASFGVSKPLNIRRDFSSSENRTLLTNGGRILGITALAPTIEEARAKTYHSLKAIHFNGEHFRNDIASSSIPIQIGILASGSGTNALQLIKRAKKMERINIACIVVDQEHSRLLHEDLKKDLLGVPVHLCKKTSSMSKADHESQIIEILDRYRCTWILCAGFMRILSKSFIDHFNIPRRQYRVVNIHPSLLPAFKGKDAYKQAFDANVEESGVTLHYVDEGIDTGPLIKQASFKRDKEDTIEIFMKKGREIEWKLYPEFLDQIVLLHDESERNHAKSNLPNKKGLA